MEYCSDIVCVCVGGGGGGGVTSGHFIDTICCCCLSHALGESIIVFRT